MDNHPNSKVSSVGEIERYYQIVTDSLRAVIFRQPNWENVYWFGKGDEDCQRYIPNQSLQTLNRLTLDQVAEVPKNGWITQATDFGYSDGFVILVNGLPPEEIRFLPILDSDIPE